MPITFSYANGKPIRYYINHDSARTTMSCREPFGTIRIDHDEGPAIKIYHITISSKAPARLLAQHDDNGLVCCEVLQGELLALTKGADEINIKAGEWISLLSRGRQGILSIAGNGLVRYRVVVLTREALANTGGITEHMVAALEKVLPGIPQRIGWPYRFSTNAAGELIDYISHRISNPPEYAIAQLLALLMKEINNPEWYADHFNRKTTRIFTAAIRLMTSDLQAHYTIPEISRHIGCNDQQLKRAFQKIIRKGPYEHLMYLRCMSVMHEVIHTDKPLKAIYTSAAYSNLSNFIAGFRKYLHCTPGELRRGNWKL